MPTTNIPMQVRPRTVEVNSETKPGASYNVTLPYCECLDFRYRRGTLDNPFCKHLEAALLTVGGSRRLPTETVEILMVRRTS